VKSVEAITSEALLLPKDQRLTLAHRILASVEPDTDPGVEIAWDQEIRERITKYDAGLVRSIPGDEVLREIDQKLKK
jgi:putative addiction module component